MNRRKSDRAASDERAKRPQDLLREDVEGSDASASRAFLARRGSIHVLPGSVVDEIRQARRERGRERKS